MLAADKLLVANFWYSHEFRRVRACFKSLSRKPFFAVGKQIAKLQLKGDVEGLKTIAEHFGRYGNILTPITG